MSDVEKQIERLTRVREEIDDTKQKRTRFTAELDTHNKQLEKLKQQCRDDFDIEIEQLPDVVKKCKTEADEALQKAEKILGISEA